MNGKKTFKGNKRQLKKRKIASFENRIPAEVSTTLRKGGESPVGKWAQLFGTSQFQQMGTDVKRENSGWG